MYCSELSPYDGLNEYDILGTVCVGWLDEKYSFTTAKTSKEFNHKLFAFCLYPVRQTRGFHQCQFCESPTHTAIEEQLGSETIWLGSAEIRVFYNARAYAAPNLIYHYVTKHSYYPPDEFVEAVLNGPLPNSEEYERLVSQLP